MRIAIARGVLLGGSLVCFLGVDPGLALGAAWTRSQGGEFLLVVPTTYFHADEQFNEDGDRVDQQRFEQVEVSP